MTAHGLMFHHFSGVGHPVVQGSFTADELRRVIKAHPRLIPARDFLAKHEAGALEPDECVLTFDDGLRCQYDVAKPVVEEFGLTAFWFVPTAPLLGVTPRLEIYRWLRTVAYPSVEAFYTAWRTQVVAPLNAPPGYLEAHTYLTPEDRAFRYWRDRVATANEYEDVMDGMLAACGQTPPTTLNLTRGHVLELAREGHVVGTHSHTHPTTLAKMTNEQQEIEYATSTYVLGEILRRRPVAMSHPCNQYSAFGLGYLVGLGYTLGFRATPETYCPADHPWAHLQVPRVNSADL